MKINPYIPDNWNGIMLVGEAPGEEEVKQNEPFVGRSGILLREMLYDAGINRDECYITNTFLLRPPDNKVMHFFVSSRKTSDEIYERFGNGYNSFYYPKPEFMSEIDRLDKEINKWQPKVIIALGATAMWRLCPRNSYGITQVRGQVCDYGPSTVYGPGWGIKDTYSVLITFHPAYCLRNRTVIPLVVEDLKKAKELLDSES